MADSLVAILTVLIFFSYLLLPFALSMSMTGSPGTWVIVAVITFLLLAASAVVTAVIVGILYWKR